MSEDILRLALFTVLPVLLGMATVIFDRTAIGPVRRAEAFLIPLFVVGVGGSGITGFISHVFISDPTARSLGWEPGSPFQLEIGIANLAIGLLGAVASERRDGFREATVGAAAVFGAGVALVHLIDMAATDSLASGNWLLILSNLATPALLIWFLAAMRRAEREDPPNIVLRSWMVPVRRGSVVAVAVTAAAYAVGNATGLGVVWSLVGIAVAAVAFWWIVSRAASHRAVQQE